MKKRIGILISSILLISLTICAVFVCGSERNSRNMDNSVKEKSETETQTELLNILFLLDTNEISELASVRGVSAEDIPNVIMISTPEEGNEVFFIGTADELTPEKIDFILDFTQIPQEKADIVQVISIEHQVH